MIFSNLFTALRLDQTFLLKLIINIFLFVFTYFSHFRQTSLFSDIFRIFPHLATLFQNFATFFAFFQHFVMFFEFCNISQYFSPFTIYCIIFRRFQNFRNIFRLFETFLTLSNMLILFFFTFLHADIGKMRHIYKSPARTCVSRDNLENIIRKSLYLENYMLVQ